MIPELVNALLDNSKTRVLKRTETEYWDYKEYIDLSNPVEAAKIAKDILGFHNAKGGVLIVGISDDFRVVGMPKSQVLDTKILHDKLTSYTGRGVSLFQDMIDVPNDKVLWLIFIPGRDGMPVACAKDGPQGKKNQPIIRRNQYFIRINDEVRLCNDPIDFQRLFVNVSAEHLQAYFYDIDEPYFRLMAPHCEHFIGREKLLQDVYEALTSRHPLIWLNGVGGVGKSAIAIEITRRLYHEREYEFIISQSAKSRVWQQYTSSRRPGFSGFTEFLNEIAKALDLPVGYEPEQLKLQIIKYIKGIKGLFVVDNAEDIHDPDILQFISREIPEPVKVLVTSRVIASVGGLPITIHQMNEDEAKRLLSQELDRVGYSVHIREQRYIEDILRATGYLPLALKWAAGLAHSLNSIKDASQRLRNTGGTKKEFLNFCFTTMFDALTPLARDVSLLCAYLKEEWNIVTASFVLDKTEGEIRDATYELRDKGIVFTSSSIHEGSLSMLPLTRDFLLTKWHENANLRNHVNQRLSDAVGSGYEDILTSWSQNQRVDILHKKAEELYDNDQLDDAEKILNLALQWASDYPKVFFLKGKITYEKGNKTEGINYMRAALKQISADESIQERLFLGQSLLYGGDNLDTKEALELLEYALPRTNISQNDVVELYCRVTLERRNYNSILKVLENSQGEHIIYFMVKNLPIKDRMFMTYCGKALARALRIAAKCEDAGEEERQQYQQQAQEIDNVIKQRVKSGT
jgi:tetratricopeptide (TPR) repeat protein